MCKKFNDLRIWREGYELLIEVDEISACFPSKEKYALASQITRSANSVIANIAESHGRYFYADRVRVLYFSRGELEETQSHLRVALGLNYLKEAEFDDLNERYERLKAGINNYITSIRNKKSATC